MGDLIWDDDLADLAQGLAGTCRPFGGDCNYQSHECRGVRTQRFQNMGGSSNFPGQYSTGENIAWGPNSPSDSGERWGEEEAVFYTYGSHGTYGTNDCVPGEQCGHFTQMIWADSQYIGCGWKVCDPYPSNQYGGVLVCNYYPPGNMGDWRNPSTSYPYVSGQGSGVSLPTEEPTPVPVYSPASNDDWDTGSDSSSDCITMSNAWWSCPWNGMWTYGGELNGYPYYNRQSSCWGSSYNFYIKYAPNWGKYILAGSFDSNSAYGYCEGSTDATTCQWFQYGSGGWSASAAQISSSSCNSPYVDDGKALNDDGETGDNNGGNSSRWTAVLVVIIGFLLIGAANAAFCVYMKRKTMVRHNMDKVMDNEKEEIEVQCELEASDNETAAVTQH